MTTRAISPAGMVRTSAAVSLLALAITGCAAGPGTGGDVEPSSGTPGTPAAVLTAAPDPTVIPGVSPTVAPGAGEGVPPSVIQAAVDDAAAREGVDPTEVTVILAESVTWPNGALGCPEPGFFYTDMIVSGYRVVVEAGGRQSDYRAGRQGEVRWCENPPPG